MEVQVMRTFIRRLLADRSGPTAIEYGLIAALIAVAAIGAMQGIGNKLNTQLLPGLFRWLACLMSHLRYPSWICQPCMM